MKTVSICTFRDSMILKRKEIDRPRDRRVMLRIRSKVGVIWEKVSRNVRMGIQKDETII